MKPSLRARVIAEWRGIPETAFTKHNAKSISEPLTRVMQSLGLGDRLREEEVKRAWKEIVGEFIASHSTPDSLNAGVLYVRVLQPTLHFELERVWKPQLIQRLKQRFGARTVRDIRFRIG